MNFSANTNDLKDALQIVNMALQARTTLSILECVLVTADSDQLTLTGSDSLMQVSCVIPCVADAVGSAAIRGKLLEDIVRKMPERQIEFEVDEKNVFTVKSGRAKSRLAGESAEQFPIKARIEAESTSTIAIPADDFCEMISSVESCIAREDASRPILTGGCFDVSNGTISAVGLDGFRLGVKEIKLSDVANDARIIIPFKALNVIGKILASAGSESIDLNFGDGEFEMSCGIADVKCTLIQGEFINWRSIIPKAFSTIVRLDASVFRDAVERASMLARMGTNKLVKLQINENSLTIYASSGIDDMQETIDADTAGDDLDIAFNVIYLQDAARMFQGESVVLHLNSPFSPCVLCAGDEVKGFYRMILPVRLSQEG